MAIAYKEEEYKITNVSIQEGCGQVGEQHT